LPRFSWTDVERFHEMELEEHWALKSIWMEELREVAIGEEEGCEQGQHLEMNHGGVADERGGPGGAASGASSCFVGSNLHG